MSRDKLILLAGLIRLALSEAAPLPESVRSALNRARVEVLRILEEESRL